MADVAGVIPAQLMLVASLNGPLRRAVVFGEECDPFDLTGFTFQMAVKSGIGGTLYLTLLSSAVTANGSGLFWTADEPTELEIYISKLDVQAFPVAAGGGASEFVYDILVTEPGGDSEPWVFGTLVVSQGVTL